MMDINCDMGEGLGNEAALMPFIDSANIACGYHAGDEKTMQELVKMCLQHGVNIGAHPSFYDLQNFGCTPMHLPPDEVYELVMAQLKTIQPIVQSVGAKIHHVKPHGALYNMAARDRGMATAIANAVKDFDDSLVIYGLAGSVMIDEAKKMGLKTAAEAFADRSYQQDGSLTPRSQPNALLQTVYEVEQQVLQIMKQRVKAHTGEMILVEANTLCIHGDGPHALAFAKAIRQLIPKH